MTLLVAAALAASVASAFLAAFGRQLMLPAWEHPDAAVVAIAAPSWSMARLELARASCVAVAAAVAVPFGAWPIVPLAACIPSIALRRRAAAIRDRAAARSLEILQATHAALRSGMPLAAALRLAVERGDPAAAAPFAAALGGFELNASLSESMRRSADHADDRRVSAVLEAFAVLAEEPLPASRAATLVAGVADRLVFERRVAEEVRARTGGMRAQIVLLALVVPALSAYLVVSMPGLAATLATPLGTHVLIPAAIVLEIAGIAASRAIVRSVER